MKKENPVFLHIYSLLLFKILQKHAQNSALSELFYLYYIKEITEFFEEKDQIYSYDKAGNITGIDEEESHLDIDKRLVENEFDRTFEYDSYNRLINASYTGSFYQKVDPRISYQPNDYLMTTETIPFSELENNSEEMFNIELSNVDIFEPTTAKGFGSVNKTIKLEIKRLAREEGLLVEPIYSAKLFYEARHKIIQENLQGNILIIHSGGLLTLTGFDLM